MKGGGEGLQKFFSRTALNKLYISLMRNRTNLILSFGGGGLKVVSPLFFLSII